MHLDEYDFPVAPELIAQHPVEPRDACRLLILPPTGPLQHRGFRDLSDYLSPGDVLVVNRTQVVPARLAWRRDAGKRPGELLFLQPHGAPLEGATRWLALGRPASGLRPGQSVYTLAGTALQVVERHLGGRYEVQAERPIYAILRDEGAMPLPPYIDRPAAEAADRQNYQSVFAAVPGSAAAPTASLHFTDDLLATLRRRGVHIVDVTLHISADTFLPIRPQYAADLRNYPMHGEWYDVPPATLQAVQAARQAGRQVVAGGTTALRALEACATSGQLRGQTKLFIYPGVALRLVTALLTNFHRPRSTLLLLVAALCGRDRLLGAYAEAAALGYRFFSYGDAMLCIAAAPCD